MSCLAQVSLPGENEVLICLSVEASVQCCIVMSGTDPPVRTIFISQRPALRTGSSTAAASVAGISAARKTATANGRSCLMLRAPVSQWGMGLVERHQRPLSGAIGHPAAGKGDVAALIGLYGQE